MKAIPILKLTGGSTISALHYDAASKTLLIGVSDGRIIKATSLSSNAYLAGTRSVFAQIKDGFGRISASGWSNLTYALKNIIMQVSEGKVPTKWLSVSRPFSAQSSEKILATFISPPMYAGDDFVRWELLNWSQVVSSGSGVRIAVRVADSEEALASSSWCYFYSDVAGGVSESLDRFNLAGAYVQMMVEMVTYENSVSPQVGSLSVSYRTKFAVYFFTTKFKLEGGSNASTGLITASMSVPTNTEVKFGVVGTNSTNWLDYKVVDLEKLFVMPDSIKDRLKVGIKLISYSDTAAPSVDEFGMSIGASKLTQMNK
jgi:hypothetical protein